MDHTIIPVAWKNFLSKIQTLYPEAIIAGGALRDVIIDKPIKDVDLFIRDTGNSVDVNKIAELFGIKVDKDGRGDHIKLTNDFKVMKDKAYKDSSKKYGIIGKKYALETHINQLFDVQYNGVLYQLIFVEVEPVKMVYSDFDFGICKVWFDGEDLVVSEEFEYDLEHKQLTLSGSFSEGQLLHTLYVHRPNLVKKFPNWKVVIDILDKKKIEDFPPSYQRLLAKLEISDELQAQNGYVYGEQFKVIVEHKEREDREAEERETRAAMKAFKREARDFDKFGDLKIRFPNKYPDEDDDDHRDSWTDVSMNGMMYKVKTKSARQKSYGEEIIEAIKKAEVDLHLLWDGNFPMYNHQLNERELTQLIKQLEQELDAIGVDYDNF